MAPHRPHDFAHEPSMKTLFFSHSPSAAQLAHFLSVSMQLAIDCAWLLLLLLLRFNKLKSRPNCNSR